MSSVMSMGEGHHVTALTEDERRAATVVEREGRRVAAIVHDEALSDDPELLHAVSAAAALVLDNARASRPNSAPGWRSFEHPALGSLRPGTVSGSGSSATCTMAPSSGSPPLR
jgi:hypothetical protein